MKKPVRKLVSFAMVLAMLLGIFSVVPAVAAGSDNFFSITPKLQKDVEEYIMKGTLDTDANLLYGLTPQRIYTYKNGYDGEKELMKLGTNVGTGGKNAYTYKGSNALGSQFKAVAALTNGRIEDADNDLNFDASIWERSNSGQYLGFEWDLGDSAFIEKFYVAWANGTDRQVAGYEIYASNTRDTLYSEESKLFSTDSNKDSVNIVTFPQLATARYFAVRITKCDDGTATASVYPRCKQMALSGRHSKTDYAVKTGYQMPINQGSSTQNLWMNGKPVTDKSNVLLGKAPVYIAYTENGTTQNITSAVKGNAQNFTNGTFDDSYFNGYWKDATYMNDNTYEDIAWDLEEERAIKELWLAFRPEVDSNPFFAAKYAIYAGSTLDTLFSGNPIITVDANCSNVNRVVFGSRTARYFGIRLIVPNLYVGYGESNIRMSLSQVSLLGDYKKALKLSAVDAEDNALPVVIEGSDTEVFDGQTVNLKIPAQYRSGDKAYLLDGLYENDSKVQATYADGYYNAAVVRNSASTYKAKYRDAVLLTEDRYLVAGGREVKLNGGHSEKIVDKNAAYEVSSELTIDSDGMSYNLYGWKIDDEFTEATPNGKYSFNPKKNTEIKVLYTAGEGMYTALFCDMSGNTIGVYRIPSGETVKSVVTDEVLSGMPMPTVFGYTFSGNWSNDLNVAYDAPVTFKAIYTKNAQKYTVSVNGTKQSEAAFDTRITISSEASDFSAWKNGKSVVSTDKDYTLYIPGTVNYTESNFGAGNEIADYAALENSVVWGNTENYYNNSVMCSLNGVGSEEFVKAGVIFTTSDTYNAFGTDWREKFILGADGVAGAALDRYPNGDHYMVNILKIRATGARVARAFVTLMRDGVETIFYSSTSIYCDKEGSAVPQTKLINAAGTYASHPMLNLYGDRPIPYYNAAYSSRKVQYSSDGKSEVENRPTITPYVVSGAKSAVVIYPGGGYFARSDSGEGMAVANAFNQLGITAFVVRYRVGNSQDATDGYNIDAILSDGQRGVQYVRANAEEFGIDPNKIAVCGFSAGGHLSMMVSQNEHGKNPAGDRIGDISSLPNAAILCYAVTTLKDGTFSSMPPILSGGDPNRLETIKEQYSGELHVTEKTPPTFLWYGTADAAVNPQKNSMTYYDTLQKSGVLSEIHSFKNVAYGVGLGVGTAAAGWQNTAAAFLKKAGFDF